MAVKLKVNKDVCIGCGACVGALPEAFTFDAEGKAECVKTCFRRSGFQNFRSVSCGYKCSPGSAGKAEKKRKVKWKRNSGN